MTNPSLPTWEEVESQYLRLNMPAEFVLRDKPRAVVSVGADRSAISVSFEIDSATLDIEDPLSALEIRITSKDRRHYCQLIVVNPQIFRPFFLLAIDLVYSIATAESAIVNRAIKTALTQWAQLFEEKSLLSKDRQLGLFGELHFLGLLTDVSGPIAVQAWTGPARASHDFRLSGIEFEVKATYRARRRHEINGINQLQASKDCQLYLISLRVSMAGSGGRSLNDKIGEIRETLSREPRALNDFEVKLAAVGYADERASLYHDRYSLADDIKIMLVDDKFPRLTTDAITSLNICFGSEQRITVVSYIIDVTGLGDTLEPTSLKGMINK